MSASRLLELSPGETVIVERGPLDFVAYLHALDALGRTTVSPDAFSRAAEVTSRAMAHVDLVVVVPLDSRNGVDVPRGSSGYANW